MAKAPSKKQPEAPSVSDDANIESIEQAGHQSDAESSDKSLDSANASQADATEQSAPEAGIESAEQADIPSVNVSVLPVKHKADRLKLVHPFDLGRGAHNIIVKGVSYKVDDIKFNPHTHRQEIELAGITIVDDAELNALLEAGWSQE